MWDGWGSVGTICTNNKNKQQKLIDDRSIRSFALFIIFAAKET